MENRSTFILMVLETLKRYSNESKYLTQAEIAEYIKKDYGVSCERKAIHSALMGIEEIYPDLVEKGKKGVAIIERQFSKEEVIPLMMALKSFKGLSTSLTNTIIKKLKEEFSINEDFPISDTSLNRLKVENIEVYNNMAILFDAIKEKKYVSLKYNNGHQKSRNVTFCPHYIFVSQEEFKVLVTYSKDTDFKIYNLDSITELRIRDDKSGYRLQENPKYKYFDIDQFTNEHLYWYEKEAITAKIKMEKDTNKKQIIKWFGKQANFISDDIVEITNDIDSLYFWLKDYSEYLEVLEPIELREKLFDYGKHLTEKYK